MKGYFPLNVPTMWTNHLCRMFDTRRDGDVLIGTGVGPYEGFDIEVRKHHMSKAWVCTASYQGVVFWSEKLWWDERGGEQNAEIEASYHVWARRNGIE